MTLNIFFPLVGRRMNDKRIGKANEPIDITTNNK